MAGLFWLMAGKGDGSVSAPEAVKGSDGKPLIIPAPTEDAITQSICTQPFAHDWDGDGDLDILSGNFEGTYFLFRNEGSREKAGFAPTPTRLDVNGRALKIQGVHSGAQLVDWDGDGDLDLLSGSSDGGAQWAENTRPKGEKGEPVFSSMRLLLTGNTDGYGSDPDDHDAVPPEKAQPPTNPGGNTRVWAADVNGDGKMDLLLGDSVTMNSRAAGLSEDAYREKRKAWVKKRDSLQSKMRDRTKMDAEAQEKLNTEMSQLYRERSAFDASSSVGFVWLALGK